MYEERTAISCGRFSLRNYPLFLYIQPIPKQVFITLSLQIGEVEIRYQDVKFWMSKLEEDKASIQTGMQQLNLLKEKLTHLVASIKLCKSLKDLSSNFDAHNNIGSSSDLVGDLAPEMEFWADPVLHKLYLLPIARSKDEGMEKEPSQPQKEKRPTPQGKKPQSRFSSIKKLALSS
jgi:hypothetical protein